jgi:hypothetical protein
MTDITTTPTITAATRIEDAHPREEKKEDATDDIIAETGRIIDAAVRREEWLIANRAAVMADDANFLYRLPLTESQLHALHTNIMAAHTAAGAALSSIAE